MKTLEANVSLMEMDDVLRPCSRLLRAHQTEPESPISAPCPPCTLTREARKIPPQKKIVFLHVQYNKV